MRQSRRNLEGILEFLKSIGKTNVILAESPAGGSVMEGFNNYGYPRLAKKYGIKLVDLDTEPVTVVQCIDEKDFQPHPVRVAKIMMDPANNFVISAAKLKTHDLVGSPFRSRTLSSARVTRTRALELPMLALAVARRTSG